MIGDKLADDVILESLKEWSVSEEEDELEKHGGNGTTMKWESGDVGTNLNSANVALTEKLESAGKPFSSTSASLSTQSSSSLTTAEERAALDEVQELLDVVEHLLVEDDKQDEGGSIDSLKKDEEKKEDSEHEKDETSSYLQDDKGISMHTRSEPEGGEPKARKAHRIRQRLLDELHKNRIRVEDTLRKVKAKERLTKGVKRISNPVPDLKLREHPAVLKTRNATRRIVTGSHEIRVRDFVVQPEVVRVLDKYTFTTGVLGIMATEYVLCECPHLFRYYYVMVMGPMLFLRYILYKRAKWHYFLYDFCYWVNALCFVLVALSIWKIQLPLPLAASHHYQSTNELWWQCMFVCANGPLLSAIVAWNNSMVFHSVDKVTSVYVHIFPALLSWCERWESNRTLNDSMGFLGAVIYPLSFYVFWQAVYLIQTEVLDKDKLNADPELATSLRYLAASTKSSINKTVLKICRSIGVMSSTETFHPPTMKVKLIFVAGQLVYSIIVCAPGTLWYNFRMAHTTLVILVLTASIYNGARYYVQVFSKIYDKRYNKEVREQQGIQQQEGKTTADAQQQNGTRSAGGSKQLSTDQHEIKGHGDPMMAAVAEYDGDE